MAKWDRITTRGNVDDRRGRSTGPVVAGGIGGLGIIGVILMLLFGGGGAGGLEDILNQIQAPAPQQQIDQGEFEGQDDYEVFASQVLGSTNDTWNAIFAENGREYTEPTLVLFRNATQSACGGANSQVGPHYCPLDETIYLDETFFDEVLTRFGAEGGDVAEAYVLAHEVGHHVQNELNIMDEVQRLQRSASSQAEANEWSVRLELQADCFAGVWANTIKSQVDLGPEIGEAIDAAEAVGDDRIQETIQGRTNPESWTHGSSAQRVEWFNRGYNSGDASTCDTFS